MYEDNLVVEYDNVSEYFTIYRISSWGKCPIYRDKNLKNIKRLLPQ